MLQKHIICDVISEHPLFACISLVEKKEFLWSDNSVVFGCNFVSFMGQMTCRNKKNREEEERNELTQN